MVSLEPTKIADYLFDYANLNYLMLNNQEQKINTLFNKYIKEKTEDCDFKTMLNIYVLFLKIKTYCINEDYNLKNKNNFINNENLDLTEIKNNIIRDGNFSSISDKKILQLIRDAFCHTTDNKQLYNISANGKIIEFNLKRPNPITLRLKLNDIMSLNNSISDTTQTLQLISLNWDDNFDNLKEFLQNLKINRYYFPKRIDMDTLNDLKIRSEEENYKDFIDKAETVDEYTIKELELNDIQINDIVNTISILIKSKVITEEEYRKHLPKIINILISKKFPLPVFKAEYYRIDSFMTYYLYSISDFTYSDTYKIITNFLPDKKEKEFTFEKHYEQEFDNDYDNLFFKIYYGNYDEKVIYPYMLFIEYVISNFCYENEYIKIGKRSVLFSKLRNSLIHSRWIINGNKITFYDAPTNLVNETNYNWTANLDFTELCEYCVKILEQKKINNKQYKKTIN